MCAPMDRGHLQESNGAKTTWEFIYSEELGQGDRSDVQSFV